VLAISGGGQSALQFALRHPARCRALMLISACTAPIEAKLPLRFYLLRLAARFPWLLRAMASEQPLEARLRRAIRNPAQRARLQADADALALFDELQGATVRHMPERMAGTLNDIANSRAHFKYPLERIAPPVLLAHGDADEVAPFAASAEFADRNPGAQLLRLRDGEHVALFTHRGEVQAAVAELLDRVG
jgi:pimeloyl-ACP methyl ester carboxylesterase